MIIYIKKKNNNVNMIKDAFGVTDGITSVSSSEDQTHRAMISTLKPIALFMSV